MDLAGRYTKCLWYGPHSKGERKSRGWMLAYYEKPTFLIPQTLRVLKRGIGRSARKFCAGYVP